MSKLKRRTLKKRRARDAQHAHKICQRLKDKAEHPERRRSIRFQGRWRFMPEKPFEYTLSSYPQLVCAEPGR